MVEPIFDDTEFEKLERVLENENCAETRFIRATDFESVLENIRTGWDRGEKLIFGDWDQKQDVKELRGGAIANSKRTDLGERMVEIEHLFCRHNAIEEIIQSATSLIDKIDYTLSKYGFRKIGILADLQDNDLVSKFIYVFVKNGFNIENSSLRDQGGEFYMTRELTDTYPGDRYDIKAFMEWLGKKWNLEDYKSSQKDLKGSYKFTNSGSISLPILVCADFDNCNGADEYQNTVDIHIDHECDNGGVSLDLDDIRKEANKKITIPSGEYYAIAVLVRPNKYNQFESSDTNLYLDGGQYGCLLASHENTVIDDPEYENNYIVFASSEEYGKILGIGRIHNISNMTPSEVYEVYSSDSLNTSFDDFTSLRRYINMKSKITGIKFETVSNEEHTIDSSDTKKDFIPSVDTSVHGYQSNYENDQGFVYLAGEKYHTWCDKTVKYNTCYDENEFEQ